jgi:hypothetical protein
MIARLNPLVLVLVLGTFALSVSQRYARQGHTDGSIQFDDSDLE